MIIEKDKFNFIKLNLLLAIREGKSKRNVDDLVSRLENILEVVNEADFFEKIETEIFGKEDIL